MEHGKSFRLLVRWCQLAAVDLDWGHVRAVDIFAALRSFLPAGGALRSVTVYPSDYGLQRMKEDASAGPQVHPPPRFSLLCLWPNTASDTQCGYCKPLHSSRWCSFSGNAPIEPGQKAWQRAAV